MFEYYRKFRGWSGNIYRVRMPEEEVKGVFTTTIIFLLSFSAFVGLVAFVAGLCVGW